MMTNEQPAFQYLITVQPLGLLYGSSGRFLSPEDLVGPSQSRFPPTSATLSGLFAHCYGDGGIRQLQLSGPFWTLNDEVDNFRVPLPMNCRARMHPANSRAIPQGELKEQLAWTDEQGQKRWCSSDPEAKAGKSQNSGGWIAIQDWSQIAKQLSHEEIRALKGKLTIYGDPWTYVPHLHPRLQHEQRRTVNPDESDMGSLFLEKAVQLHPDVCLAYLSTQPLPEYDEDKGEGSGWYRFGGEGHMAEVGCRRLSPTVMDLLEQPVSDRFALLTPAIWGSNRHSMRGPKQLQTKDQQSQGPIPVDDDNPSDVWEIEALLTERPDPFRYRLGRKPDENGTLPKMARLSRGRYAVPAGTVYVLKGPEEAISQPWRNWPSAWFPQEGVSFKRWGCGLALPL